MLHHLELWVPDLTGSPAHGGCTHAAYLADAWGYEVEIQAGPPDAR